MLKSPGDLVRAVTLGTLKEHLHTNLELKEDWAMNHGNKISGLANKLEQLVCFLAIGINDAGVPIGQSEKWARQTEECLSQHINQKLDPVQACTGISCHKVDSSWIIVVRIRNPGEVTYWGGNAYYASGTTVKEMPADDILKLRMQLPGLLDFSKQTHKSMYETDLVRHFVTEVASKAHTLESAGKEGEDEKALRHLGLYERQASRILFGACSFRVVYYNTSDEPSSNLMLKGLYHLLLPDFIDNLTTYKGCSYSRRALKEAFANAVAHAAYFENDGEILLEIYAGKLVLSNLCISDATFYANRWFSRSHKTVNGLLMESLRIAGVVDELGRGKNLIFSESIRLGKRAPEVIIEKAGRYERWKLVIYGGSEDYNLLRLLDRSREIYNNERKALIAHALVLWRDKPVAEISKFIDGEYAREFAEVLSGNNGPIFYWKEKDRIELRRWAEVLIGEGKDSKALSPAEEEHLLSSAYSVCMEGRNSYVTPKDIRELAGMFNSKSEQVLSSSILANWSDKGIVTRVGHGKYKFVKKAPSSTSNFDELFQYISESIKRPPVEDPRGTTADSHGSP